MSKKDKEGVPTISKADSKKMMKEWKRRLPGYIKQRDAYKKALIIPYDLYHKPFTI